MLHIWARGEREGGRETNKKRIGRDESETRITERKRSRCFVYIITAQGREGELAEAAKRKKRIHRISPLFSQRISVDQAGWIL